MKLDDHIIYDRVDCKNRLILTCVLTSPNYNNFQIETILAFIYQNTG